MKVSLHLEISRTNTKVLYSKFSDVLKFLEGNASWVCNSSAATFNPLASSPLFHICFVNLTVGHKEKKRVNSYGGKLLSFLLSARMGRAAIASKVILSKGEAVLGKNHFFDVGGSCENCMADRDFLEGGPMTSLS